MKKVQKRIFICVILIVVVFAIFTAVNVNAFYNERVESILVTEGDRYQFYPPEIVNSRKATYVADLRHALLSNVYIHEYFTDAGQCMQIRFRVTYAFPFMHEDMFWDTAPEVADADGDVLNSDLIGTSDQSSGFHGMSYVVRFVGDDIPKPGEKIYFSFTATEEGTEAAYASGRIVIEI